MVEPDLTGGISGGILIGLASVLLLAGSGRIAGISGILSGLYDRRDDTGRGWRVLFLAGLIAGAGIISLAKGGLLLRYQAEGSHLVLAGLLVGLGTRLSGGCTSGHGVCGLARLSKRSLLATVIFISTAMLTVFVIRHIVP